MTGRILVFVEIVVLSLVVVTTRCANYADVFVGGEVYFTDADCYSRMTRARMCFEHPGLVVRHHQFENFPAGTNPHVTAPLDYMIVGVAELLRPFSARALELAGAFISPAIGLGGAWFLWGWLRKMRFRFRGAALGIFAASPIVVHATELGRPDHQALALVLVVVGLCAEWTLQVRWSRAWSVASAFAWGLALWVSLYEPLIIFVMMMISRVILNRRDFFSARQRPWWFAFVSLIVIACIVERRPPAWPLAADPALLASWLSTIGELRPLALTSRSWLEWCGYLLLLMPIFAVIAFRRRQGPPLFVVMIAALTFCLTIWQARWGYFFVAIFGLLLPELLSSVEIRRLAIWAVVCVSFLPLLQAWDSALWPNESATVLRVEHRLEMIDLRRAAAAIVRATDSSFIAPWWLSPAVAYWSGSAGVAGSSHQSLEGIADTARFFLASDPATARAIISKRHVAWALSYDADRVGSNSAALLGIGETGAPDALGRVLARTPSRAPPFLISVYGNGSCKVFRVEISSENAGFP